VKVKLYELNDTIREICEQGIIVDEETGEILFEGTPGLQLLEMERTEKLLAIAKVIKEQSADFDAYETERKALAKRMMARAAAMEKRIEWLKAYLVENTTPDEKVKDGVISLSFRTTESVAFEGSAEHLPEAFRSEKVTYTPNKEAIKAALKSGEAVIGASIVSKVSPTIR
jgi:hypothetical protein